MKLKIYNNKLLRRNGRLIGAKARFVPFILADGHAFITADNYEFTVKES